MGWALYLRPHTNKHGKKDVFYRVTSVDGQFKKTIPNCKVRPEDFNKRTNQVNGRSDNATIINETLNTTTTLLQKGWGLYESGNYTWDELKSYLGGNRPDQDLEAFIYTYLKDNNREQVFKGILDSYGSAKKYLGKELTFKDLNYNTTNKLINLWKDNLRSGSVKTYKYHWSLIVNAAYTKKYTPYKFENVKKWRIKKDKVTIQGNPYVTTSTPQEFFEAIDRCTNLMHINGLGFWLFAFSMRGMYFTDLNVLHNRENWLTIDHPTYGDSLLVKHFRNKTEEPMYIWRSFLVENLRVKLRGYLEYTHGEATHYKTKKLLRKTKENHLSYKEEDGWFFKEYNKARWNTISKQCTKIGFPAVKYARKTFETVALTLEVSAEIRDRLLGHEVRGVKGYYQNWLHDELQDLVQNAHEQVMEKFKVEELYNALINKANEILERMGVDVEEFNDKYKC
jgi:hypothetical protein